MHFVIGTLTKTIASETLQLGLKFFTFFSKLTEMMEGLSKHLGYLAMYAESFKQSQDVQEVDTTPGLRNIVTDLSRLCPQLTKTYSNSVRGPRKSSLISMETRVVSTGILSHQYSINSRSSRPIIYQSASEYDW
jgi:hypothetical protein